MLALTCLIPERTLTLPTNAVAERTYRAPALASDLAGDPLWDPLPLPDPELNPDELDELERIPLDPRPDAELLLEEEEVRDCDRCGEGDLAHLCLEGERTAGREQAGRPRDGIVSASFETWTGAVEVEAAGITLAILTGLPRVLRMMASFKMSSAFLLPSKDGG